MAAVHHERACQAVESTVPSESDRTGLCGILEWRESVALPNRLVRPMTLGPAGKSGPPGSRPREDGLADDPALVDIAEGAGEIGMRILGGDDGADLGGGEELDEGVLGFRQIRRIGESVTAPDGADDGEILDQSAIDGEGGDAAGGEADDEETSFGSDALRGQIEGVAADGVVDDIGSAAGGEFLDFLGPGGIEVVDGVVGSEGEGEFAFLFGTGGGERARAIKLYALSNSGYQWIRYIQQQKFFDLVKKPAICYRCPQP